MKLLYFVFINMLMIMMIIHLFDMCEFCEDMLTSLRWIKMTKDWGKRVPMLLHHSCLSRKKGEKGGRYSLAILGAEARGKHHEESNAPGLEIFAMSSAVRHIASHHFFLLTIYYCDYCCI